MASRSFLCIQCERVVTAGDADEAVSCSGCDVVYRARCCAACGDAFVAVGDHPQTCPWCESTSDPGSVLAFDAVRGPLGNAMSPAQRWDHEGDAGADHSLAGGLDWYLTALALVVLVVGLWLTLEVHRALSAAHASGRTHTIGVTATLVLTIVFASILFALGHLVERGADLRRQLVRLDRRHEAHQRATELGRTVHRAAPQPADRDPRRSS